VATEFGRIAEIRRRARRGGASVALGIGDDAAILRPEPGFDTVVATDLLVESIHFDFDWTTPELLGHKALAVSLSDLAAMGARPVAALFSIAMARSFGDESLGRFFDGALRLADRFGVEIVGGDMSSSPGPFVVDAVVLGSIESGRALRRSGARAGDQLWVSGTLGTSARGLELLSAGSRLDSTSETERAAIVAHLAPVPRVELGRALVEGRIATAAIDVSDGLSSDVGHMCVESRVGIVLDGDRLASLGNFDHVLHGGEQYELLFAAPPSNTAAIIDLASSIGVELTPIGRFEGDPEDRFVERAGTRQPLTAHGWDHFAQRDAESHSE